MRHALLMTLGWLRRGCLSSAPRGCACAHGSPCTGSSRSTRSRRPGAGWISRTTARLRTRSIYAVRVYDLVRQRLLGKPLLDPREPDQKMRRRPVTRIMSADGRWAYTLYDGGSAPFIHALDTVARTAFCVELPALRGAAVYTLRLARTASGSLAIERAGIPLTVMDTRTLTIGLSGVTQLLSPPGNPVVQS
jgi:hypothetical protein